MTKPSTERKRIPFGAISLLMMAAVLLYSFLPSSVLPIPPVFLLIVLAGALLSLLSAIIAGLRGSRAWFLAVVPPIAFFFILAESTLKKLDTLPEHIVQNMMTDKDIPGEIA